MGHYGTSSTTLPSHNLNISRYKFLRCYSYTKKHEGKTKVIYTFIFHILFVKQIHVRIWVKILRHKRENNVQSIVNHCLPKIFFNNFPTPSGIRTNKETPERYKVIIPQKKFLTNWLWFICLENTITNKHNVKKIRKKARKKNYRKYNLFVTIYFIKLQHV